MAKVKGPSKSAKQENAAKTKAVSDGKAKKPSTAEASDEAAIKKAVSEVVSKALEKVAVTASKPSVKVSKPRSSASTRPREITVEDRTLGSKTRPVMRIMQIDLGRFDLKQNGELVGQLVVSPYINGVIVPGVTMEYYYLCVADSGSYKKFKWPSKSNSPESIKYVWSDDAPGSSFDPVQHQYSLSFPNELIACQCVNMGTVYP
jgi:hypothetical protein